MTALISLTHFCASLRIQAPLCRLLPPTESNGGHYQLHKTDRNTGRTITIRAYGNAKDANGKILASAWCEATVQRVNSYIDPADAPDVENAALTSLVNRNFGRQFLITGFRWLNQDEI